MYYADFICYNKIIIELKSVHELLPEHKAQVINYLKASGEKLGILVNFGKENIEYHRLVRNIKV
jgi:GxxExxY protein